MLLNSFKGERVKNLREKKQKTDFCSQNNIEYIKEIHMEKRLKGN